ncbi:FMN-dependent dehydrogenase [Pleurostoma richardsiae]|uniref:L-lactate dehydrogenase (cytochrome) n=1 Tax=Pleurostoma richardsiae TaxID=41990 RepID=A0AA38R708_9PEZI|nr:FMN-dependent dehydrogenase [Pleurostoma richardsiae]
MVKEIDAEEVAKHTSPDSCWVILYGNVYDVTSFLGDHPGGSKIILKLAGRDATEEYDPIHPPGTLEENLKPEANLGPVNKESLARKQNARKQEQQRSTASKSGGAGLEKEDGKLAPVVLERLLNLDDIEAAATQRVSKKCWSYYYSAGDDMFSKTFNNAVYRSILLRPRVFVDCTACDTSTTLLGQHRVGTPIYVSPAAMARLAHPDGEAGIARGIAPFGAAQCVSNNASMTPEQVIAGAKEGQVFGWQLYVQTDRRKSEVMLARINKLRKFYKFIVLTLDAPVPGKRETDERAGFDDDPAAPPMGRGGVFEDDGDEPDEEVVGGTTAKKGGVGQQLFVGTAADLTWHTTLPWLRQHTDLPVVLKGVQTHEDAYLAAKYARENPGTVKAVVLSNHGGRALDTAPPAVHTLLEIRKYCPSVFDDVDVWIDGGIKRGTDVVKALCLGAKAVGVGRAALWGLGAGGWKGVRRTFEILQAETETCMRLLGAKSVEELGPRFINARAVERDIFDGGAGLDEAGLGDKAAVVKSKL